MQISLRSHAVSYTFQGREFLLCGFSQQDVIDWIFALRAAANGSRPVQQPALPYGWELRLDPQGMMPLASRFTLSPYKQLLLCTMIPKSLFLCAFLLRSSCSGCVVFLCSLYF